YGGPQAGLSKGAGRHAQQCLRLFIETALRAVAGLVDGVGDAGSWVVQLAAQAPGAMRLGLGERRQSRLGLEDAVEVVGAHSHGGRQFVKAGCVFRVFDQAAGLGYGLLVLQGLLAAVGVAVAAGAKAGLLRLLG